MCFLSLSLLLWKLCFPYSAIKLKMELTWPWKSNLEYELGVGSLAKKLWFALISSYYSENKQNILKALRGHTLLTSLPASFNLPGFLVIQHLLKTCSESIPVVSLCGLGSVERIPGETILCESGHSRWKNIFSLI